MAVQKLFSVTAKNVWQLVALLMKGNQRLVLLLFLTFRVLRNPSRDFEYPQPVKDPVTEVQRTDTISSIPCNDCGNEYIRPTKRQFDTRLKEHQKVVLFCKKENSALSEHTCLNKHTLEWDKPQIITINRRCHQCLCLKAWHINSAHAPLNRDDCGLLPDSHLHPVRKKVAN